MTAYSVDFHPDVVFDYADALDYYEQIQAGLGDRLLENIKHKINIIATAPETFGSKGRKKYREALIDDFPYLIIYKVYSKNKTIFISAIRHSKMSAKKKYRK